MRISDWSSDVCSSDLAEVEAVERGSLARGFEQPFENFRAGPGPMPFDQSGRGVSAVADGDRDALVPPPLGAGPVDGGDALKAVPEIGRVHEGRAQIGRASGRERVVQYV